MGPFRLNPFSSGNRGRLDSRKAADGSARTDNDCNTTYNTSQQMEFDDPLMHRMQHLVHEKQKNQQLQQAGSFRGWGNQEKDPFDVWSSSSEDEEYHGSQQKQPSHISCDFGSEDELFRTFGEVTPEKRKKRRNSKPSNCDGLNQSITDETHYCPQHTQAQQQAQHDEHQLRPSYIENVTNNTESSFIHAQKHPSNDANSLSDESFYSTSQPNDAQDMRCIRLLSRSPTPSCSHSVSRHVTNERQKRKSLSSSVQRNVTRIQIYQKSLLTSSFCSQPEDVCPRLQQLIQQSTEELKMELSNMQHHSKINLEKSWAEAERIRVENTKLEDRVLKLKKKLAAARAAVASGETKRQEQDQTPTKCMQKKRASFDGNPSSRPSVVKPLRTISGVNDISDVRTVVGVDDEFKSNDSGSILRGLKAVRSIPDLSKLGGDFRASFERSGNDLRSPFKMSGDFFEVLTNPGDRSTINMIVDGNNSEEDCDDYGGSGTKSLCSVSTGFDFDDSSSIEGLSFTASAFSSQYGYNSDSGSESEARSGVFYPASGGDEKDQYLKPDASQSLFRKDNSADGTVTSEKKKITRRPSLVVLKFFGNDKTSDNGCDDSDIEDNDEKYKAERHPSSDSNRSECNVFQTEARALMLEDLESELLKVNTATESILTKGQEDSLNQLKLETQQAETTRREGESKLREKDESLQRDVKEFQSCDGALLTKLETLREVRYSLEVKIQSLTKQSDANVMKDQSLATDVESYERQYLDIQTNNDSMLARVNASLEGHPSLRGNEAPAVSEEVMSRFEEMSRRERMLIDALTDEGSSKIFVGLAKRFQSSAQRFRDSIHDIESIEADARAFLVRIRLLAESNENDDGTDTTDSSTASERCELERSFVESVLRQLDCAKVCHNNLLIAISQNQQVVAYWNRMLSTKAIDSLTVAHPTPPRSFVKATATLRRVLAMTKESFATIETALEHEKNTFQSKIQSAGLVSRNSSNETSTSDSCKTSMDKSDERQLKLLYPKPKRESIDEEISSATKTLSEKKSLAKEYAFTLKSMHTRAEVESKTNLQILEVMQSKIRGLLVRLSEKDALIIELHTLSQATEGRVADLRSEVERRKRFS